jgi:hypothetical protein
MLIKPLEKAKNHLKWCYRVVTNDKNEENDEIK